MTIRENSWPLLHPGTALPARPYVYMPHTHNAVPAPFNRERGSQVRGRLSPFIVALREWTGREAKAPRPRGEAWKDTNERRRGDELMTRGGLDVSSLLSIVLQAFLGISRPVSSLCQTHTCTFSSPPTRLSSCHCLRSQKQNSDARVNRPRRWHEFTGTNLRNSPQLQFVPW